MRFLRGNEGESLRIGGRVLRGCLQAAAAAVKPGITTGELDRIAEEFILSHEGATPAFKGYRGFPATLCISINEQCVHGLPGHRVIEEGDIVSLDGGVIYKNLYTDACVTVAAGSIPPETQRFLDVSSEALDKACALVRPGTRIGDISSLIQKTVEGAGYYCLRALTGHGLGTTLHQFPDVPNLGKKGTGPILPAYTIIAIEPITSMGTQQIVEEGDGWTLKTADSSLSAHFEHTVLVTPEGCEILT